jgi:hypothetical protein
VYFRVVFMSVTVDIKIAIHVNTNSHENGNHRVERTVGVSGGPSPAG